MLFCVNLVPCTKQESVINIIAYKSGVKTRFEIALFLYNKTVYDEKNNFIVPKNKTKRKQNKESERYFGDRKFFSIWEKERERNFSTPFLKVYLTYPYVDWVCDTCVARPSHLCTEYEMGVVVCGDHDWITNARADHMNRYQRCLHRCRDQMER